MITRICYQGIRFLPALSSQPAKQKPGESFTGIKYHNAYRAEVTYNDKKYRRLSIDRGDCEQFLRKLAAQHTQDLL